MRRVTVPSPAHRGFAVRILSYLLPWQFSPLACAVFTVTLVLYVRGLVVLRRNGAPVGPWRPLVFFLGLALNYAVLQTYFDFLAQHMFWVHRLQHLILHHIGPVLLVLSAPVAVLKAGLPQGVQRALRLPWIRAPLELLWRALQHPLLAPVLFVGLIYYWLTPSVHFTAMLDTRRYLLMNWSMLIDGILFWWLILAPREAQGRAAVGYGLRFVILAAVAVPQIVIGAYIALVPWQIYSIYAVCGRAWAISPMLDQQVGGLLTWIPGAMMSVVGVLVVLHHILHEAVPQRAAPGNARARAASSHSSAGAAA